MILISVFLKRIDYNRGALSTALDTATAPKMVRLQLNDGYNSAADSTRKWIQ